MPRQWRPIRTLVLMMALLLLAGCGGEEPVETPEPPAPGPRQVEAESNRDDVFTVRGDERETLPAPDQTLLEQGDGVDVNENGRAILRFADLLTVEVLRDGELTLQELTLEEQSAFVTVAQRGGALINDFDPEELIDRRFTVQSEFATVTATGTRFMVVKEANSPLEWVVAMQAEEGDLTVMADGVERSVTTGMARWIAPIGEPSAGISADMENVDAWIEGVRAGDGVPEIGDTVWEQADVLATTDPLDGLPAPGENFTLEGVEFTLDPGGLFGAPSYDLEDCNGDGITDVAIEAGRLTMDFRTVMARVRALDVTVWNRAGPDTGSLRVLNPAREEMSSVRLQGQAGETEVLSLRSDAPYHYAELAVTDGCFLGFSLTPPQNGEPGAPRPAVPDVQTEEPGEPRCTVVYAGADGLSLRSGPGTEYDPPITTLYQDTTLVPLARNSDGTWLYVGVEGTEQRGWVNAATQFVTCNVDVSTLDVRETPPTPTPAAEDQASVRIDEPREDSERAVTNGFVLTGESFVPPNGRLLLRVETAGGQLIQEQELEVLRGDTSVFERRVIVDYGLPADARLRVQAQSADGEVLAEDSVLLAPLFAQGEVQRPAANGQIVAPRVGPDGVTNIRIDRESVDWMSLGRLTGVEWTEVSSIVYDDGCSNRFDSAGEDLEALVRFAYDETNLYVAFQVFDDGYVPYTGDDQRYFLGDAPQVLLDTDLADDFHADSLSADDLQIDLHPGAVDPVYEAAGTPRAALWALSTLSSRRLQDATVAGLQTDGGYFLEAALPWEELAASGAPEPGTRLGVVASVSDNDTPETNRQECMISTAPQRDWRNPTTWGTLTLE